MMLVCVLLAGLFLVYLPIQKSFVQPCVTPCAFTVEMRFPRLLCGFVSLAAYVTAAALNRVNAASPPHSISLSTVQAADALHLQQLILNASTTGHNAPIGPQCDEAFGNPPLTSCLNALTLIPKNNQPVAFGQRRSVGWVDHVSPLAWVSCKPLSFHPGTVPLPPPLPLSVAGGSL